MDSPSAECAPHSVRRDHLQLPRLARSNLVQLVHHARGGGLEVSVDKLLAGLHVGLVLESAACGRVFLSNTVLEENGRRPMGAGPALGAWRV